jgi:hypothetical protein
VIAADNEAVTTQPNATDTPVTETVTPIWRYGGFAWRCVKHGKVICVSCGKEARRPSKPPGTKGQLFPQAASDEAGQIVEAKQRAAASGKRPKGRVFVGVMVGVVVLAIASASAGGHSPKKVASSTSGVTTVAKPVVATTQGAPTTPPPPPTTAAPITTTTAAPPTPTQVAHYSGSSDKQTPDFDVTDTSTWKIAWTVSGGAGLGIAIYDSTTGNTIDHVSADPGSDETIERQPCKCYLKLTPFGSSYNVTVTDLKTRA